ncbi:MAG: hypothetical protein WD048_05155 [Chitinophagales bacterium]
MKVYSLVGPSAAGKSTAIKKLSVEYNVLDLNYMELNTFNLDNRLMVAKWKYIDYWFSSILESKRNGIEHLLTDRCPIDTCAYVSKGEDYLLYCLTQTFEELKKLGINMYFILITADLHVLENRIKDRIKREANRINYNELNKFHNKKAYDFFSRNKNLWNSIIDTSCKKPEDVVELIKAEL